MSRIKEQRLIVALQEEKHRLQKKGRDTIEHAQSIHFLRTGFVDQDHEVSDLLEACMNDFDCVYSDYCL